MAHATLLFLYSLLIWHSSSGFYINHKPSDDLQEPDSKLLSGIGDQLQEHGGVHGGISVLGVSSCESKCPKYFIAPKPVCDKSGKEYYDACWAKCAGISKVWECKTEPKPCPCTTELRPVCSNGHTYPNKCIAECNRANNIRPGSCPEPCICPLIFLPVCYKGENYPNECSARCKGAIVGEIENGECQKHHGGHGDQDDEDDGVNCRRKAAACLGTCPDVKDPVCVDGITYKNACETACLCPKPKRITPGKCRPNSHGGHGDGDAPACTPCRLLCVNTLDPVCADGVTYNNICFATCRCPKPRHIKPGRCRGHNRCACPKILRPVCYNQITYSNYCLARCDGAPDWDIKPIECCRPCAVKCTNDYGPVCADGKTFRNRCDTLCLCPKPRHIVPGQCKVHGHGGHGHGVDNEDGHGHDGYGHTNSCFGTFNHPIVRTIHGPHVDLHKRSFIRQGKRIRPQGHFYHTWHFNHYRRPQRNRVRHRHAQRWNRRYVYKKSWRHRYRYRDKSGQY